MRIGHGLSYNMLQEGIRSASRTSTHERTNFPLPCENSAIKNEKMIELTGVLMSPQICYHVIIREYEDKHAYLRMEENNFLGTREVNFLNEN